MAAIAAALIILCSLLPDDEVPIPWGPCKVLLWLVAQIASFPLFVSLVADVRTSGFRSCIAARTAVALFLVGQSSHPGPDSPTPLPVCSACSPQEQASQEAQHHAARVDARMAEGLVAGPAASCLVAD